MIHMNFGQKNRKLIKSGDTMQLDHLELISQNILFLALNPLFLILLLALID